MKIKFPRKPTLPFIFISLAMVCVVAVVLWMVVRPNAGGIDDKRVLLASGDSLLNEGRYQDALVTYNKIIADINPLEISAIKDPYVVAEAYLRLARIYSGDVAGAGMSDYGKSYSMYSNAAEISDANKIYAIRALALLGMAEKYEEQQTVTGDTALTDTIIKCLKESLRIGMDQKNWRIVDNSAKLLATAAFYRARGPEIYKDMAEYLALSRPANEESAYGCFIHEYVQTMLCIDKGNLEEAVAHTHEMEKFADCPIDSIDIYVLRAEAYHRMNDQKMLMQSLDSMTKYIEHTGDIYLIMQGHKTMSDIYKQYGDSIRSDTYRYLYYDAKEQMMTETSAQKIKDFQIQHQIDRTNQELRRVALERQMSQRIARISICALIIITLVLALYIRSLRQLKISQRHIFKTYNDQNMNSFWPKLPSYPVDGNKEFSPASTDADSGSSSDQDGAGSPGIDKDLPDSPTENEETSPVKYGKNRQSPEKIAEILSKLRNLIDSSEIGFSPDCQLKTLASLINESPRAVSQAINEYYHCNFATFIAEFRINTVCRRITESPAFRRMTIEAMAESVGIQSRSHFSTTFKKVVGLNPSQFIRQVEASSHNARPAQESEDELDLEV